MRKRKFPADWADWVTVVGISLFVVLCIALWIGFQFSFRPKGFFH